MKRMTVNEIITAFNLIPLSEEGGFFGQTWKADCGTAIYYLITPESWSSFHLLKSVEVWHFYYGDPVKQIQLFADGRAESYELGFNPEAGTFPQLITPANVWQSTRLVEGGEWALCGNTMAPPFLESEYVHGNSESLLKQYPEHEVLIKEFL